MDLKTPAQIHKDFIDGVPLSDNDLAFGIDYFKRLADMLVHCGPTFRLAFKEANNTHICLSDYQKSRNERNKK